MPLVKPVKLTVIVCTENLARKVYQALLQVEERSSQLAKQVLQILIKASACESIVYAVAAERSKPYSALRPA